MLDVLVVLLCLLLLLVIGGIAAGAVFVRRVWREMRADEQRQRERENQCPGLDGGCRRRHGTPRGLP